MYLERKVAGFEMAVENICKFFKFGHCKFGQTCYNQHINELCENRSCEISSCVKRHPSKCKYFNIYKRCKFGEFCSFLHVESRNDKVLDEKVKSLEADVESLKNKMIILKTTLQSKENDIKNLQISLENLNKDKCENEEKGGNFCFGKPNYCKFKWQSWKSNWKRKRQIWWYSQRIKKRRYHPSTRRDWPICPWY